MHVLGEREWPNESALVRCTVAQRIGDPLRMSRIRESCGDARFFTCAARHLNLSAIRLLTHLRRKTSCRARLRPTRNSAHALGSIRLLKLDTV
ncbi:hypothetical protein WS72_27150 [Burkholderia savannae]|uniref:Uncharacterized protein n=1 Tax=Burkholderia savannae TaxID=1637837 RepID=A0ABR5T5L2_9BURK|nr:hypothetical protein WS72_27150 [Burkholderia savannae]KWZ47417.1 hypothetical protein WS73_02175 [Burkholderia savannae]